MVVVAQGSGSGSTASTATGGVSFDANGLAAVDSYYGIDAKAEQVADARTSTIMMTTTARTTHSRHGGMKDFIKSSMKRRRRDQAAEDDLDDHVDRLSSDDEEEEGRTCISKSKTTIIAAGRTKNDPAAAESSAKNSRKKKATKKNKPKGDNPIINGDSTTKNKRIEPSIDKNNADDDMKEDAASAAVEGTKEPRQHDLSAGAIDNDNHDHIINDDQNDSTKWWGTAAKRKKTRSRQKNIRKDNRDVKPSFTRDPTAPGYRPLTAETKEYLRHKNWPKKTTNANTSTTSSSPVSSTEPGASSIIAQLNQPEYTAM